MQHEAFQRKVVDSHCHLDRFADPGAVIARARDAGVDVMLAISTGRKNFDKVLEIAKAHDGVFACAGVHPCDVGKDSDEGLYDWLVACAAHPKVVGLGETGLDQFHPGGDLARQEQFFRMHLAAAQATGLPVVVHTRNSDEAFLRVMADYPAQERPRGVLHCFTGGAACALAAVSWGWKVSLSGIVTFANAREVQHMARQVPLDSLLVETDAPWLAPQSQRGRQNEPAFVVETVQVLADLHGVPVDVMAAQTTANFFDLFAKAAG